jgi:hypothetical protein
MLKSFSRGPVTPARLLPNPNPAGALYRGRVDQLRPMRAKSPRQVHLSMWLYIIEGA